MSSGENLTGDDAICCDGLKSGETVSTSYGRYSYDSCDDYVNNGEYVKDACPRTCSGKSYKKSQFIPILTYIYIHIFVIVLLMLISCSH